MEYTFRTIILIAMTLAYNSASAEVPQVLQISQKLRLKKET